MSQENLEIAGRAIEAFNRRDLDLMAELTTADFELFPGIIGAVEGASFRGREGLATYLDALSDAWETARILPTEVRDLDDRVLVLARLTGRGRGSGVELDSPQGLVYYFRAGKIFRCRAYLDHGEALRAAGLSE
jgi:ketosteroid isomerase-like protein